jgi:16S rRNA (uracil1498-N3)-methyltransferase
MAATHTLPIFYQDTHLAAGLAINPEEDTARHIVQVLRMGTGERLELANGKGLSARCVITEAGKKKCTLKIEEVCMIARPAPQLHLAVGFTRNAARNEWLLEKATELGVQRITPVIGARTVRERFRYDRFKSILVAGMIQSQQYWLPQLDEPTSFEVIVKEAGSNLLLIAHCMDHLPRIPVAETLSRGLNTMLLIGPEGDFTEDEVTLATASGATGISLGNTRLRTETAAIAAIAAFHLLEHQH